MSPTAFTSANSRRFSCLIDAHPGCRVKLLIDSQPGMLDSVAEYTCKEGRSFRIKGTARSSWAVISFAGGGLRFHSKYGLLIGIALAGGHYCSVAPGRKTRSSTNLCLPRHILSSPVRTNPPTAFTCAC